MKILRDAYWTSAPPYVKLLLHAAQVNRWHHGSTSFEPIEEISGTLTAVKNVWLGASISAKYVGRWEGMNIWPSNVNFAGKEAYHQFYSINVHCPLQIFAKAKYTRAQLCFRSWKTTFFISWKILDCWLFQKRNILLKQKYGKIGHPYIFFPCDSPKPQSPGNEK